jgi:hypothetical protein
VASPEQFNLQRTRLNNQDTLRYFSRQFLFMSLWECANSLTGIFAQSVRDGQTSHATANDNIII